MDPQLVELLRRLRDWYYEWPDPRIRKHGKFESEVLWLQADIFFKETRSELVKSLTR